MGSIKGVTGSWGRINWLKIFLVIDWGKLEPIPKVTKGGY